MAPSGSGAFAPWIALTAVAEDDSDIVRLTHNIGKQSESPSVVPGCWRQTERDGVSVRLKSIERFVLMSFSGDCALVI
jgi:hypothetical protein